HGSFLETHGTILHGKRLAVELIVRVLACLAEGLGIRATARVFEVDPNTVLQWLVEAAEQLHALARSVLCDFHINQVQRDELYAVLRAVKEGALRADEAIQRLERSQHWVEFIPLSFWYDAPLTLQDCDRRHDPWLVYGSPIYSPARWSSW